MSNELCPSCGNPLPEDSSKCWFCSTESNPIYHRIKAILEARPGNVELVGTTEYAVVTTSPEKIGPLITALIQREKLKIQEVTVVIDMVKTLGQAYTPQHWSSFTQNYWYLIRRDSRTLANPIGLAVRV